MGMFRGAAILAAAFLLFSNSISFAQTAVSSSDSLSVEESGVLSYKQLIAPAVLMGAGVAVHCFAHESVDYGVRDIVQRWRGPVSELEFDDYLQYLPAVVGVGLGCTGVKSKHDFVDRLFEVGVSYVTLSVIVQGMKHAINSPRPNNVDSNSFPSGHTATAFAGAELVRMEYGLGIGLGAYAVVTSVAFMRIYNNEHWFSDLLAGAAIGVLCAHVGEWLLVPVKHFFGVGDSNGVSRSSELSANIQPSYDPLSGAVCATFSLKF